jgi:hypothetical protein
MFCRQSHDFGELFAVTQKHFTLRIQGFLQLEAINGKNGGGFDPLCETTEENDRNPCGPEARHAQNSILDRLEADGAIGCRVRFCERQILPGLRKKNKADKLCLPAPERWDCQNRHSKIPPDSLALHRIEAKVSHVRNGRKISGWGRWCKPYDEDLKKFLFKVKHCRKHRFLYSSWKIPENPGIMVAYEGACADQVAIRLRAA